MNRGPLAALQRGKFRLLVRWKSTLKAASSFRVLPPSCFPHGTICRAFEEILRLTRLQNAGSSLEGGKSALVGGRDHSDLSPDQYMDVFLIGREVLADHLAGDARLVAAYNAETRNHVRHALDDAVRHLVDVEMRAYFQRQGRAARAGGAAAARRRDEAWVPELREA